MFWFLLWLVLSLVALAVLGLLGWRTIKKAIAVGRELATAADRMSEVQAELGRLSRPVEEPVLSVFAAPADLRAERQRLRRDRERDSRARRRTAVRAVQSHPQAAPGRASDVPWG